MDGEHVRRVDTFGRIVIPSPTRRRFNLGKGDRLSIQTAEDTIKLRRLELVCAFCGTSQQVRPFHGKGICARCTAEVARS